MGRAKSPGSCLDETLRAGLKGRALLLFVSPVMIYFGKCVFMLWFLRQDLLGLR